MVLVLVFPHPSVEGACATFPRWEMAEMREPVSAERLAGPREAEQGEGAEGELIPPGRGTRGNLRPIPVNTDCSTRGGKKSKNFSLL